MILVKIITFASTAIPIESMIPAIPGNVSVISNADKSKISSITYNESASTDANPGSKNTATINTARITNPTAAAFILVDMASCPSFAPTTLLLSSSSSRESEPIRIVEARFFASSYEVIPVICAVPPVIAV